MNQTGDVAKYQSPLKFDSTYRGCPCFHLSKPEFRGLIKYDKVPKRVLDYSKVMGINKIYMKNMETMVTINFEKFSKLFNLK